MKQRITAAELKAMTMKELAEWIEFNACAINRTMVMSWGHEELFKGYHIRPEYTGYIAGRLMVKAFHFTSRTRKADAQSFAEWLHWAIFGEYPAEETAETAEQIEDTETEEEEEENTVEKIKVVYEKKEGRTYTETWRSENPEEVYERLSHSLIAKKLNNCGWIRSIKRVPLYNGFDRITVTHDNGGRDVYTVASH